jgi:hypothetical protein
MAFPSARIVVSAALSRHVNFIAQMGIGSGFRRRVPATKVRHSGNVGRQLWRCLPLMGTMPDRREPKILRMGHGLQQRQEHRGLAQPLHAPLQHARTQEMTAFNSSQAQQL